ncbi:MAG: hypothetical protein LJE67_10890 [Salaquimonas sp.]|nr:hypothetical protein [Salaquimonas sp.]
MLDWTDYVREIAGILTREVSDPPPFKFPEGCGLYAPDQLHQGEKA